MITVQVELGPRNYPILVGVGMLPSFGETLRTHGFTQKRAFIVTNPQVGGLYGSELCASLERVGFQGVVSHEIPAQEEGKNWDEFTGCCAALAAAFPETGAVPLVIALGGGVVGDLAGFAAGVFRRGVPFVQVPTTLLSAVDSSVGGKVGVNFGAVKNLMGVFNQPRLVFADLALLKTLDPREVRSGLAEIIKYGAVCSAALFEQLEDGALERLLELDSGTLTAVVAQCCRLKAEVVERDEFDKKGIRNVLNFGHTIGHALEMAADYQLTHGEAISIGMIAATRLSIALGKCQPAFLDRLRSLFIRAGLPDSYPDAPERFDRIVRAMQMDKKFRDGRNLFVLPIGIGAWEQQENIAQPPIDAAIRSVLVGG